MGFMESGSTSICFLEGSWHLPSPSQISALTGLPQPMRPPRPLRMEIWFSPTKKEEEEEEDGGGGVVEGQHCLT